LRGRLAKICGQDNPYEEYWRLYGGFKSLLCSPYFWVAALVTLACFPYWLKIEDGERVWAQTAIDVVPSIMGFSLGGMAIMLAFSNERFLSAIREDGSVNSLFMKAVALFFHFLLIQAVAISFAFISKAWSNDVISFIGFFFMVYGVMAVIAIAGALLQIAQVFNATESPKKDDAQGG